MPGTIKAGTTLHCGGPTRVRLSRRDVVRITGLSMGSGAARGGDSRGGEVGAYWIMVVELVGRMVLMVARGGRDGGEVLRTGALCIRGSCVARTVVETV